MKKQGFTLIELLVVIAIIGILSSVVLASLSSARNKGADATMKGNINGIRSQAEVIYSTNNSYATVCSDPATIKALTSAAAQSPSVTCVASSTAWGVIGGYKSDSAKFWCVDSQGNAQELTASSSLNLTTDFQCGA